MASIEAANARLDFRLLGPLEVWKDGKPVRLGGERQRALLALLLLHANEVVSSDRMIDEIFDGQASETARNSVQAAVSRLRRVLGDRDGAGIIVTRSPGYVLRAAPEQVDLLRFERLLRQGRQELVGGDPRRAAAVLREALGLWRGSPLADLGSPEFAERERRRLAELRLAALVERTEADLGAGGGAELVGELEALVGEHPLHQRLRAQLMLALYRSGRDADALGAYREARKALVEELGVEPGRELRELQRAILNQDPDLDLIAEATTVESRGVFVGRERELEELSAGLEDAFAGRGRLFLLVGEPGIGKTRLAEELIGRARARGARVLVGRCWEADGAPAFWPWVQALRTCVHEIEPESLRAQLGAGATDLAQLLPELRGLFPDLPAPELEVEGARFRLFDSALRFLRNMAAAQPLVLALDDLHAADEPSLLLLRFVAGELVGSRILALGIYRDVDPTVRDPLASTLAELAREEVTRRIELRGLSEANVSRYVELVADQTPPADVIATIRGETEGNPLFVGEIVRLLAAEGHLSELDVGALLDLGVPQGVREVIGRRLQRLSDECRRMLTFVSVIGREFALEALQRVSELPGDDLLDVLDEAMAARVVTSVPGAPGRLRFGHALIRETLYEGLTTPRRVQLHRRVGEALEALYEQDPEPHLAELAHHFFEAAPGGDVDKALGYSRRAADHALDLLAYEEAARLNELALQALDLMPPMNPRTRCDLLLALGDALARGGSTPEAKETFLAAADLARASRLTEHLARAALGYGGRFPWLRAGSDRRLVPLLEEALEALGGAESVLSVRLLARLAGALRDEPSLEQRSSLGRRAVEIARRIGDPDTLGYALASLFTATWGPDIEEVRAIVEEVTRLAEETGEAERALDACWLRRIFFLSLGDVTQVEQAAEEHRMLAEALKQPSQQWYDAVMRSTWALFLGAFPEAEKLANDALRLGRRAQSWDAVFSYRMALFFLRREQDRLAEVEELTRRAVDEYTGYRSFPCLLALLEWELGRPEDARHAFEELAIDDFVAFPRDSEWLFCLCVLSEVAGHLRDRERASTLYRLLAPYSAMNALAAGEVAIGSVARYVGILACAASLWEEAGRHFEDALVFNERMGAKPWLAHTQEDYARMLLARAGPGDRGRAAELLSQAHATYRELGMKCDAAEASAVPQETGTDAPSPQR